jgi:probable addiction module antidote protein
MTKTVTTRYDVTEYLRGPEEMAAYLDASLEEADRDAVFIAKRFGDLARARGMSQVACDAGLSRESLYMKIAGEHSLSFDTVLNGIGALGLKFHVGVSDGGPRCPPVVRADFAHNRGCGPRSTFYMKLWGVKDCALAHGKHD